MAPNSTRLKIAAANAQEEDESFLMKGNGTVLGKNDDDYGEDSIVLTSTHHLAPYPKLSDLPPVGQSLFPVIWERDPSSPAKKQFSVVLTSLFFVYMIFPDIVLERIPWLDVNWDVQHEITNFCKLLEVTLGFYPSSEIVRNIFLFTFGVFTVLVVADIILGQLRQRPSLLKDKPSSSSSDDIFPWPESWNTNNYLCYHEMFSEPTRYGRLLRRPGNTLSNFSYVLCFLAVFSSCAFGNDNKPNPYWASDIQFGIMIMILAVCSVIWHGSNAPWSQYPDLCSMYSGIIYVLLRYLSQAAVVILIKHMGFSLQSAQPIVSTICFLVYTTFSVLAGGFYYVQFTKGWLHGGSPESARARILGTSNVFAQGHEDASVATVCAFTGLPFAFLLMPTLSQIFLYDGQVGSKTAAVWAFRTIAIGWYYRIWERFVLDGHPIMNYFLAQPSGLFKTIGCAIVSPTAQHHVWTGATLLAAYCHSRSMEGLERPFDHV